MATILVIDDEPSILHAFRRAFADPEVTLLTASDGAEGLELVARCRPDVVVLDINLPDMSGLDVFRRIRTIDARIPVIFITGHGTTETAIEAMKQGAFDYLLKPLDLDQLTRAGRAGVRDQPADAHPRHGRRRGAGAGPGRRPRRPLPGDAGGLQGDRPGRPAGRDRADPRRERHRQGAGRPGHLPAQPAGRRAVPGDQLRRHPGDPAGERAVRPREGGVHRGRPPADRQVRAVLRRHAVPRRDRRHDAADAGEDAARAPGAGGSSGSAATRRSGPTCGSSPPPTATWSRWSADGRVPRRPVLPAERLHDHAAAAPRARPRTCRSWSITSSGGSAASWARRSRGSPRRRWRCSGATPGRATSASCRAS